MVERCAGNGGSYTPYSQYSITCRREHEKKILHGRGRVKGYEYENYREKEELRDKTGKDSDPQQTEWKNKGGSRTWGIGVTKTDTRSLVKELALWGVYSSSDPAESTLSKASRTLYRWLPRRYHLSPRQRWRHSSRRASRTGRSEGSSCRQVTRQATRKAGLHPEGPAGQ